MVSYEYSVAFSETLDILNHTRKEDIEKIPIKFLDFLRNNTVKSYESKLDFNKAIIDMDLNAKTIGILSIIYKKYWCNDEEKKAFEEKLKQNEIEYQKQLSEKYNKNELFKDKIKKEVSEVTVTNLPIEVKKNNFFKRLIDYIRSLFMQK